MRCFVSFSGIDLPLFPDQIVTCLVYDIIYHEQSKPALISSETCIYDGFTEYPSANPRRRSHPRRTFAFTSCEQVQRTLWPRSCFHPLHSRDEGKLIIDTPTTVTQPCTSMSIRALSMTLYEYSKYYLKLLAVFQMIVNIK